jgi:hypothetical protein
MAVRPPTVLDKYIASCHTANTGMFVASEIKKFIKNPACNGTKFEILPVVKGRVAVFMDVTQ